MSSRDLTARREAALLLRPPLAAGWRLAFSQLLTWPPFQRLICLAADLLAITVAHTLAFHAVMHFLRVPASALNPSEYHRSYIPFFAVVLYLFEGYKNPELRRPEQELERSAKAVAVSFLGLVLFNFVVYRSEAFSRWLLAWWFVLACVLLVAARLALRCVYDALWKAGIGRRRAVLAGSPAGLAAYRQLLSIQRHHGREVAGVLLDPKSSADSPDGSDALPFPVLGSLDDWEDALARAHANVLIVAHSAVCENEAWLQELLRRSKQLRVDVELFSGVWAASGLSYEQDEFAGCFRFYAAPQWSLAFQRALKRAMDVAIGLAGSIVTILMTPAIFALVNWEDRGPVFYQREFVASDGTIRHYRKFRTMLNDADEILRRDPQLKARFVCQYKLKDDPRLLRIGRFLRRYSLDEFPQFFSVLSGELTFVGPRVISGEERRLYGSLLPKLLSFKPGLTGFWQVMGRQTTSYEERIRMDMFYVDRWTIWLDLVIIAKTFWKVLRAEGAY